MSGHVVLIGDSTIDNAAYTDGEPDVAAHLRSVLGPAWTVTALALDGSTTATATSQIRRIPADTTAVVVSIGGNDALDHYDLLTLPVRIASQALEALRAAVDAFEERYGWLLDALPSAPRRIACTVYNGRLDPRDAGPARAALMMFNDAIVRTAAARGVDVIDLRAVVTAPSDYANPIEPSGPGGYKIACAIAAALRADDAGSRIHARPQK